MDPDRPLSAKEKRKENLEKGKGASLGSIMDRARGGSTNFEFSSSNPMWRASLETLDFLPLTTVDYSGGVIITDWYSQKNNLESIKITIRFLSNEIRADGLKIIIHERIFSNTNATAGSITKIKSNIESEIKLAILKRATELKKKTDEITKEKNKRKILGGEKKIY